MSKRWFAAVMLVLALLVASASLNTAQRQRAGAMPEALACTTGLLGAAGSAFLLVAAPPAGTFQVIVTGALGLGTVAQVIDACGAWVTVDLGSRLNIFGPCTHDCAGGGGGGGAW